MLKDLEKLKAYHKAYREANKEKISAQGKAYRHASQEANSVLQMLAFSNFLHSSTTQESV